MALPAPLPRSFYARTPPELAPDLIGALLLRRIGGRVLAGLIVETEAYLGPQDRASHARAGITRRTRHMFGPPGHAYVYRLYGMYWAFNVVGHAEDEEAGAVLIRAALPVMGVDTQRAARGRPGDRLERLAAGPGRLCQALALTGADDGRDLTVEGAAAHDAGADALWIAGPPEPVGRERLLVGPRVNVESAGEPWATRPFRFGLSGSPALSMRFGPAAPRTPAGARVAGTAPRRVGESW